MRSTLAAILGQVSSPFDAFAWFYDQHWAGPFADWQMPALERLLFAELHPGAQVLDLCCGTGTLARRLAARGYITTGIDSSHGMLAIAREKVPEATFFQAEAAAFAVKRRADAVVCVFDSLNNVMEPEPLARAFSNVRAALRPGGCFVFDINSPDAYGEHWDQTFADVQPDHAFFIRGGFDRQERIGHTRVTMFRFMEQSWRRSDVELRQRPWEASEVERMLGAAGFHNVRVYRAIEDLNMAGHYGIGRVYFRAVAG